MSASPLQRAIRAVDDQVRVAYAALTDHSMACPQCRARTTGGPGCEAGLGLLTAWSRARKAARRR